MIHTDSQLIQLLTDIGVIAMVMVATQRYKLSTSQLFALIRLVLLYSHLQGQSAMFQTQYPLGIMPFELLHGTGFHVEQGGR